MKYGLRCPCHGARIYESYRQRDAHAITFQCKQEWFRIIEKDDEVPPNEC